MLSIQGAAHSPVALARADGPNSNASATGVSLPRGKSYCLGCFAQISAPLMNEIHDLITIETMDYGWPGSTVREMMASKAATRSGSSKASANWRT